MGPRTSFFNKLPDDVHAAVSAATLLEPLFYWLWFLRIWGTLISSVLVCNTRKGKNVGGHGEEKAPSQG